MKRIKESKEFIYLCEWRDELSASGDDDEARDVLSWAVDLAEDFKNVLSEIKENHPEVYEHLLTKKEFKEFRPRLRLIKGRLGS